MGDSEYSFSLTTFSPSGKLAQIEYALAAVQAGGTSIGIKAFNGVVLVTEKKLPTTLIDPNSFQKMSKISENIGLTYSGMGPDSRVLIKEGQKKAQDYFATYKDHIPIGELVKELASTMQEYTQSGGVRPFGISLLIAGVDHLGPHLYQVDPSGSFWSWKAAAIGKNMINANTSLEKRFSDDMEIEDAIHAAILTLKEGFDGKLTNLNFEIAVIKQDREFRVLSPKECSDYLKLVE